MDRDHTQTVDVFSPIIRRFERAWQSGQPPSIADFLPSISNLDGAVRAPPRRALLLELVLVDFEFQWKLADQLDTVNRVQDESAGAAPTAAIPRRPRVEHYLRTFPELGAAESPPVEMVVQEYRVRHRWGDRPLHDEYTSRFQKLGVQLRPLLSGIDEELRAVQPMLGNPSEATATQQHAKMPLPIWPLTWLKLARLPALTIPTLYPCMTWGDWRTVPCMSSPSSSKAAILRSASSKIGQCAPQRLLCWQRSQRPSIVPTRSG